MSLFSCGRSAADFEFGLGSFSLLDEIVTGQEWAKFLNPNLSAASAVQRPSEEPKIQPNPYDSSQTSVIMNHQGGVDKQWSFRGAEASPVSDFSRAQISPDAFQPVSMDVSEGKQQQDAHREADQPEPMEHGHAQSDVHSGVNGPGQQLTPRHFTWVRKTLLYHQHAGSDHKRFPKIFAFSRMLVTLLSVCDCSLQIF